MDEFKMCCGTTCDKRKVQEQIDALAAQVELMTKAIKAIENDCIECSYDDESGYFVGGDTISEACDLVHYETPAACLAQVRADALEAEADLMLTAPQACEYDRQLVCKIGAMLKSRAALVRAGGAS